MNIKKIKILFNLTLVTFTLTLPLSKINAMEKPKQEQNINISNNSSDGLLNEINESLNNSSNESNKIKENSNINLNENLNKDKQKDYEKLLENNFNEIKNLREQLKDISKECFLKIDSYEYKIKKTINDDYLKETLLNYDIENYNIEYEYKKTINDSCLKISELNNLMKDYNIKYKNLTKLKNEIYDILKKPDISIDLRNKIQNLKNNNFYGEFIFGDKIIKNDKISEEVNNLNIDNDEKNKIITEKHIILQRIKQISFLLEKIVEKIENFTNYKTEENMKSFEYIKETPEYKELIKKYFQMQEIYKREMNKYFELEDKNSEDENSQDEELEYDESEDDKFSKNIKNIKFKANKKSICENYFYANNNYIKLDLIGLQKIEKNKYFNGPVFKQNKDTLNMMHNDIMNFNKQSFVESIESNNYILHKDPYKVTRKEKENLYKLIKKLNQILNTLKERDEEFVKKHKEILRKFETQYNTIKHTRIRKKYEKKLDSIINNIKDILNKDTYQTTIKDKSLYSELLEEYKANLLTVKQHITKPYEKIYCKYAEILKSLEQKSLNLKQNKIQKTI